MARYRRVPVTVDASIDGARLNWSPSRQLALPEGIRHVGDVVVLLAAAFAFVAFAARDRISRPSAGPNDLAGDANAAERDTNRAPIQRCRDPVAEKLVIDGRVGFLGQHM